MTALAFRRATDSDRVMVVRTFLDSTRTMRSAGLIAMDDWEAVMRPQAEKLLARPGVEVLVAYAPGEEPPFDVYGWLAHEKGHIWPYVLFVYVFANYRKNGIARRLLAEAAIGPDDEFRYAVWLERSLAEKVPLATWSPLTARYPVDVEHERALAGARRERQMRQAWHERESERRRA